MAWSFKSTTPIYHQILEEITARIFDGSYPPGGKIPSVREIAEEAAVNPNTVQRAFSELENSGLVVTMRTAGREVTSDLGIISRARQSFAVRAARDFLDEMRKHGFDRNEMIGIMQHLDPAESEENPK